MITILVEDCNTISQKIYDDVVNALDIRQLRCPSCGHFGCFVYHGTYQRTVKTNGYPVCLSILRVKCSCGHTHALLLSSIVPYSQIPALTQARIAGRADNGQDFSDLPDASLDESNIRSVIRSYRKHWQQRLRFAGIRLADFALAVRLCFASFNRQFMQVKCTPNILFLTPT